MQETAGEFVYFVKKRQRTYSSQAKFTDGFLSGFTSKLLAGKDVHGRNCIQKVTVITSTHNLPL